MERRPVLELEGISKKLKGGFALSDIYLTLYEGEVLAVTGANQSGKTALFDLVTGWLKRYDGTVRLFGEPVSIRNPQQLRKYGILYIRQGYDVIESFSIGENILFDDAFASKDKQKILERAQAVLTELCLPLHADSSPDELNASQKELVKLCRVYASDCRIAVLDEPKAILHPNQRKVYENLINKIKNQGKSLILITKQPDDILCLADRVLVLDDGVLVKDIPAAELESQRLRRLLLGAASGKVFDIKKKPRSARTVLEASHLRGEEVLRDCSFRLYEGEILGVYGDEDSGMEELFRILTGFKAYGGEILREQERVDLQSPYDAAKWGFYGFWNEDFEREFFRFYALSRQGDFEGSAKDRKLKNLGRTATLEDMGRLAGGMFRNPYRAVDVPHRDRQKKILDRVDKRPFEIGLFMEPFSMLDLRVQSEFLENLLTEHREQSFLIFSHDLDMLHRFCGRILHLEKGRNKN